MKSIGLIFLCVFLCSCATQFNKKKRLETDMILGEMTFKQDGKMVNKFQVFDEIGKSSKDKKELLELKKDFVLASAAAGVGATITTFGLIEKNGSNKILVGGGLVALGYYFALRANDQLKPYVEKHNRRKTSYMPNFLIAPEGKSILMGLGYNLTF